MDWIVVKDCEDDYLENLKSEEEEDEKRKRYAAGEDEDLELDVELEEEKEIPDHEKQERYIEDYFYELKKPRFYLFSVPFMPWKMYRPANIRVSEHIVLVDSPVKPDLPIKPIESFENHKPKPRPPPTHRILYPPPPDTEIKYPFAFYCEKAITEFNKKKGTQYTFGGLVEARMLYELDIKFSASLAYGKPPETFEVKLKIPGNDSKSNILIYQISLLASPTAPPAFTLVLYDPRSHFYRWWL